MNMTEIGNSQIIHVEEYHQSHDFMKDHIR